MALRQCVDCNKSLSTTALECNGCKSIDPFGKKRAEAKANSVLTIIGFSFVLIVFLGFYFNILTVDMIKRLLGN
jgi:hypothetical protein